mmetsp:Transcript_30194/g.51622  ORF Transcript_30194/g.51622 Transcript_30194/m.51622 type:complete len:105 (+) Transcript_30194:16-330(+)
MSNQQSRQSRWGAPLRTATLPTASSSASVPPAASLPKASNHQHMSEFPKRDNATAHNSSDDAPQQQLQRRGYDMSGANDYYGGMMISAVNLFSESFSVSEVIVC